MGSGSDNVRILKWAWDDTCCDETRDVSHINHKICTDQVGNLAHALVINQSAVCGGTGNQHFRSIQDGILLKLIIINDTGLKVNAVGEGLEVCRDCRDSTVNTLLVKRYKSFESFVWMAHFLWGVW